MVPEFPAPRALDEHDRTHLRAPRPSGRGQRGRGGCRARGGRAVVVVVAAAAAAAVVVVVVVVVN